MSRVGWLTTTLVGRIVGLTALVLLAAAGGAAALPLCGSIAGEVCRNNLENRVEGAIEDLEAGLQEARDGTAAIGHLEAALRAFAEARLDLVDTDLSPNQRCAQASKEDERALKEAARGVRDGVKLTASKFVSQSAFDAFRLTLRNLTRGLINAVAFNIEEVDVLGGDAGKIEEALSRVALAQAAFNNGDLNKAADQAQRAYDLIEGEVNVAPSCLINR